MALFRKYTSPEQERVLLFRVFICKLPFQPPYNIRDACDLAVRQCFQVIGEVIRCGGGAVFEIKKQKRVPA